MLSERNNGASISEVTGIYLGQAMKNVMRVFSVILLVMVGTSGASGLMVNKIFWLQKASQLAQGVSDLLLMLMREMRTN